MPVPDSGADLTLRLWAHDDLPLLHAANTPAMTAHLNGPESDDEILARHERYLRLEPGMPDRPEIVCICGSMRFAAEMRVVNRELTLAGAIVLLPSDVGPTVTDAQKAALGALHLRRIDLADRVVIVSPEGYLGESTRAEIAYARAAGKPVSFTDPR